MKLLRRLLYALLLALSLAGTAAAQTAPATSAAQANAQLNALRAANTGGVIVLSGVLNWRPGGYDFSAHPVTLVAVNGTGGFYARTLKGFVFKGTWFPTAQIPWAVRCDGCDGLTFDHTELMSTSAATTYYGALISGSQHVDVIGAYIHDLDTGLVFSSTSFVHVYGGTKLHHIGNDGIDVGGTSGSDVTIENWSEDAPQWNGRAHPDAVQVEPGAGAAGATFARLVIRNGKVVSPGQGIFIASNGVNDNYSDVTVSDNDITCTTVHGISLDRVTGGKITGNKIHTLPGSTLQCMDAGAARSANILDRENVTDAYTNPVGRAYKALAN